MTERRLPVKQLVILSICRFAEPLALTSVFPYLPEMIESFGIPKNDIARWAGLTSSIFSLCQCLTGIPWGIASDKFGRKTVILIGLTNTMITTLVWGFSTSLPMAIIARGLAGAGSGNVGILRTAVAELCPWKELQPRAFSIMPLVYTIGAIFGPTLGGALANPLHIDHRKPRGHSFLERFPYALPNIAAACIFLIGIITGFLFLKETLETRKDRRDYGLILGRRLTMFVRTQSRNWTNRLRGRKNPEREPLLKPSHHKPHIKVIDDEESSQDLGNSLEPQSRTSYRDVLTRQAIVNLIVYGLLALYTIAYDQLLPVFMHHPPQDLDSPNIRLPLKFAGGFGVDSGEIGALFTIYGIACMTIQLFIFPPIARYLGVLRCLRLVFMIFPCVFLITPFTALLPTTFSKQAALFAIMIVRGFAGTFAYPTSTILLTNSASSLRTLGTLNGIATSVSAIGRALGPAIGGGAFTIGVKHGYIIAPFWILAAIALLTTIPTFFLVEGAGFGADEDIDSDDAGSGTEVLASPASPFDVKSDDDDDEGVLESESEYGEPVALLSHTSTRSNTSGAVESDDEMAFEDGRESGWPQPGLTRAGSAAQDGRRHRSPRRRSSVPIGMGVGFRRFSSNLGSTGFAGGSWGG